VWLATTTMCLVNKLCWKSSEADTAFLQTQKAESAHSMLCASPFKAGLNVYFARQARYFTHQYRQLHSEAIGF